MESVREESTKLGQKALRRPNSRAKKGQKSVADLGSDASALMKLAVLTLLHPVARVHKRSPGSSLAVISPVVRTRRAAASPAPLRMSLSSPSMQRTATRLRATSPRGDLEAPASSPSEPVDASVHRVLPFVAVASLGALLFGFHLGVINAALAPLSLELGLRTASEQGLAVSLLLVGACGGSFAGGALADGVGRREALRVAAVPLLLGSLLCGFATTASQLLAGRLITGLGLGVTSAVVPLYISEVSPPSHRGVLGSLNQILICAGILLALVAGLPLASNPDAWRNMFFLGAVPALLLLLLAPSIPETPAWLCNRGRASDAAASALRLWGESKAEAPAEAPSERKADEGSWAQLLAPEYRKATSLAVGLYLLQQAAGINAVVFFSNSVFKAAGIANETLASAAVGLLNLVATALSAPQLDSRGRRPLLLTSFLCMALCMALLAAALSLKQLAGLSATLSLLGTLGYVAAFAIGVGPVPSLLVQELFPASMRSKGAAVAMLSHWTFAIAVGQYFPVAVEAVGVAAVYVFFSFVCVCGALVVSAFVPETRGRSHSQVQAALSS